MIGEYTGWNDNILCNCLVDSSHGIWETKANNISQNSGCPKCGKERTRVACKTKLSHTKEEYLEALYQKNSHYANGEFEIISDYQNIRSNVRCKCNMCGYEWERNALALIQRNSGCMMCAGVGKKTHEEFLEELYKRNKHYRNNEFKIVSQYVSRKHPIVCECLINDNHSIWETTPNSLYDGHGCILCEGTYSSSFFEKYLFEIFKCIFGNSNLVQNDRTMLNGKELDIIIMEEKISIEYGSWKWHKDKLDQDIAKKIEMENKGYTHFLILDNVPKSCVKDLSYDSHIILFTDRITNSNQEIRAKYILDIMKINYWNVDFAACKDVVDITPRKIQFYEKLNENNEHYRNGDFKVIGEYINSSSPIACKCNLCGYEWAPVANKLYNRNTGCPKCFSHRQNITKDEFLKDLYDKNSHYRNGEFEVVGEYINMSTYISCECPIHGVWENVTPGRLVNRNAFCPQCRKSNHKKE